MIILGIDPGIAATGYGFIKKEKLELIDYGCIQTKAGLPFSLRLKKIHENLKKIIKIYQPQVVALEELFFCKNTKTALKVGEARGAVILTIIQAKLPFYEFTPLEVKQAVSSYGRADKKQIQLMVKLLLNLKKIPQPDDAADALAVAICCAHSINNLKIK